jgi:hypothetical protein
MSLAWLVRWRDPDGTLYEAQQRIEALEAALTEAAGQYGSASDEQRNRWLKLVKS